MIITINPKDEYPATLNHIAIVQLKRHHGRGAFIVDVIEHSKTEYEFEIGCSWPQFDESEPEPTLLFPWIGGLGYVRVFRIGGQWYLRIPVREASSRIFERKRFEGSCVHWP